MIFGKMTPIKGGPGGCPCCGSAHEVLPMDAVLAVGFGVTTVEKNGEVVYSEGKKKDYWSAQDAENLAVQDPDNDWRIHFNGPLSDRHYQRQGEGHWVLYERGMGFA